MTVFIPTLFLDRQAIREESLDQEGEDIDIPDETSFFAFLLSLAKSHNTESAGGVCG
ncbi:MAG: hypothetical protein M0O96_12255 [Desulforhopalus sp.]|nr:hypothetical protein [Desulforhopalus sp.]